MSRLPASTRLKMSRPNWSVPNRKRADGACSRASMWNWLGSYGARTGQTIAHTIQVPSTTSPTSAVGDCQTRRNVLPTPAGRTRTCPSSATSPMPAVVSGGAGLTSVLGIADPRIQDTEQHFGPEIREHIHAGDDHDTRFEQRNVFVQ